MDGEIRTGCVAHKERHADQVEDSVDLHDKNHRFGERFIWATTHAHPAVIHSSHNIPMAMPITDQQIYAMSSRVEALAIDDLAEQLEVDCVYVSGQHKQLALLKLFVKDRL